MTRRRRTYAEIKADAEAVTRVCRKCEEVKGVEDYRKRSAGDGLTTWCKTCLDSESEDNRLENIELRKLQARARRLKSVYGITLEQYNDLLLKQNNSCAICLRPADSFDINLAVDHDHKSMLIRGLLCTNCNHRLVARHRDGELLRRIADYVEQDTGWVMPKPKAKKRTKRKPNAKW